MFPTKFVIEKIEVKDGLVDVGEGTQFANPFRYRCSMPLDAIEFLDAEDMERYLSRPTRLTKRDTYVLYAKYVYPNIARNDQVWFALSSANGFVCVCKNEEWCHVKLFNKLFGK